MGQNYQNYSREDHQVWNILFERQVQNLQGKAAKPYLDCLEKAKSVLHAEAIPNFEHLNPFLSAETGWTIEVVKGLIPVEEFFALLAVRKFPSSTWLRSMAQLDYLEEPDMFHDIFGHVPLLFHAEYADFMQRFGELGLHCLDDAEQVAALERLYWFTIEFGLCKENGQTRIYGAGILSSYGEAKAIFEKTAHEARPFRLEEVLNHQFRKDVLQSVYYILSDFNTLFSTIELMATPTEA